MTATTITMRPRERTCGQCGHTSYHQVWATAEPGEVVAFAFGCPKCLTVAVFRAPLTPLLSAVFARREPGR